LIDGDYVRLGSACHCGKELKLLTGRGRPPKFCEDHKARPQKEDRPAKECPACRGFFTPVRDTQEFCNNKTCRNRARTLRENPESKRREKIDRTCTCKKCGIQYQNKRGGTTGEGSKYCSRECAYSDSEKWLTTLNIPEERRRPKFSLVYWPICEICGAVFLSRTTASRLCSDSCAKKYERKRSFEYSLQKHNAAGKVVACKECGCLFCPLYGTKDNTWCQPCTAIGRKRIVRAHKALRRAREKGADCESVDPFKVFERDKWKCQLCGVKTAKSKRGTYADNAPELDHIIPLSKGGAHKYTNTQCACRKCNGLKSDKPLGQLLMF